MWRSCTWSVIFLYFLSSLPLITFTSCADILNFNFLSRILINNAVQWHGSKRCDALFVRQQRPTHGYRSWDTLRSRLSSNFLELFSSFFNSLDKWYWIYRYTIHRVHSTFYKFPQPFLRWSGKCQAFDGRTYSMGQIVWIALKQSTR